MANAFAFVELGDFAELLPLPLPRLPKLRKPQPRHQSCFLLVHTVLTHTPPTPKSRARPPASSAAASSLPSGPVPPCARAFQLRSSGVQQLAELLAVEDQPIQNPVDEALQHLRRQPVPVGRGRSVHPGPSVT
ncbi:MAG: hypothetical protein MZU84_02615 [Sphingobacterium sp.]|nr:hypothetical protein [Sphingobacterium sp.]